MLTRNQILDVVDYETKDIVVPEWHGTVKIRSLNLHERAVIFDRPLATAVNRVESEALVVCAACIDAEGKQVFTSEDMPALVCKNATAVELIAGEILKLSGLTNAEELEKNSLTAPTADSSSS